MITTITSTVMTLRFVNLPYILINLSSFVAVWDVGKIKKSAEGRLKIFPKTGISSCTIIIKIGRYKSVVYIF